MNILRLAPYTDFLAEYQVESEDSYVVIIKDFDRDEVVAQFTEIVSYGQDTISIPWIVTELVDDEETLVFDFRKYDEIYSLEIINSFDEIVIQDTLDIARPYVDPSTITTPTYTLAQAKKDELLARSIIDSIAGGFYFKSSWLETVGEGTDYVPLTQRTYKVLQAYENSKLAYDSSQTPPALGEWNYIITKDKTAITKDPTYYVDEYNRSERNPNPGFIAISDSIGLFETDDSANTFTFKPGVAFPVGHDYLFLLETGYKVVPNDIKEATLMLIDDIKCGKLDYYKRSITSYSTDQFRIQMDVSALSGTGNILVDKILDKYITDIKTPRML